MCLLKEDYNVNEILFKEEAYLEDDHFKAEGVIANADLYSRNILSIEVEVYWGFISYNDRIAEFGDNSLMCAWDFPSYIKVIKINKVGEKK